MVSVIIPVYNVEKYLDQCVESVLKLKTEIEIILVDDGSKDQSGTLCDKWAQKDSRICVIHQENGGLSAARNTGIRASKGEYVMFLDSDDFLDPEETEKMLCAQETQADCILGLYRKYYDKDERYEEEECDAILQMNGFTDINFFLKKMPEDGRSSYMVAWRFIVLRSLLVEKKLFFFEGIYHEDEEWTQRLFCRIDNLYVCQNYFYQYRQAREGAITSNVRPKHIQDRFTIMEHTQELLKVQNLSHEKRVYLKNRLSQLYLSIMIDWRILDANSKKRTCQKLRMFKKDCLGHMRGIMGRSVQISERIVGTYITCCLLSIARKLMKG